MALYKETKKKSTTDAVFQPTEHRSYDTSVVDGWQKENRESQSTLSRYQSMIQRGDFLTSDDLMAYKNALGTYVSSAKKLRNLNKTLGGNVDNDRDWGEQLRLLNSNYDSISQYYSQWKTADEYKAALKQAETDKARWAELSGGYDATKNRQEGQSGWESYVATQERIAQQAAEAKKAEEAKKDEGYSWEQFWDDLVRWIGPGVNPDTSMPFHVDTNLVAQGYQDQDAKMKNPDDRWSEEQQFTYGYLWNSDKTKAAEYAYAVNNMLNTQQEQEQLQKIMELSTSSFGAGAANTVGALITAPLGMADYLGDVIAQGALGYIPQSDGQVTPFEYSQAVTGSISQRLNEYGTLNENIPIVGGRGWGDVYGLGTSIAQSSLAAWSGGQAQALITFFGSSAASGVDDALSRGANGDQAMLYGTMLGLAEGAAEMIGVDNLMKIGSANTLRQAFGNILKQGAAEGIEEGITAVLNNFADNLVMGDKSNFNILVEHYMEQGWSEAEAKQQAWQDMAEDVAYDMLGGFASGGIHAAPVTAYQTSVQNNQTKKSYGDSVLELVAEGLESADGSLSRKLAEKYQKKLDAGKSLTGAEINRLISANEQQFLAEDKAAIKQSAENRLVELGEAGNVTKLADALTKQATKQKLTKAERAIIQNSKYGQRVANELNPKNIQSGNYSSQWASNIGTNRINSAEYNPALVKSAERANQFVPNATQTEPSSQSGENVSAENTVPPETEMPTQSDYEAAVEGKTIRKSTGEAVSIKEVASVGNGKMTLRLEDGSEVDSKEIAYSNAGEAYVFETVASLGVDAVEATRIVNAFRNSGVEGKAFADGMKLAFEYGYGNFSQQELAQKDFAGNIPQMYINTAYEIGQKMRQQESDQNDVTKEPGEKRTAKKHEVYYTTKDGKVMSMSQAEKNGKLALKDKQSVAVKTAKFLQKLGLGGNYYFFESYVDQKGNRVFKDRFGNIQSAPNGLYYSDGDIYIDINAGTDSHSITLRTLSHELTHMIQQWSAAKYKVIADFLAEQYDKEGRNAYEAAKAKQAELSALRGKFVPFQEAYHEFVADSMSTLFDDGNMYDILTDLKKKDKTLVDYIKKFFDGLAAKVRKLYANAQAETDEGQFVQGLSKDTIYRLQQMFADALVEASENYATSEQKNTDTQIGVQYSFSPRMTDAEIQRVQNIGRISVNQFSSADIKATERFAQQYWREMGVKSPFFRAWFGDWRANDQTPVLVANQRDDTRGVQKNKDTGWDIQVSGQVFNETKVHKSLANKEARPYLPYINDIVNKAVLLDSYGLEIGEEKSPNSLLMHSLYAVADIGAGPEVLKLYVEEMNDPNRTDTTKRAYQLQNIEKAFNASVRVQGQAPSSLTNALNAIHTVADLFAAVKQMDADFQPKPASKVVNEDGTPMVVYHGTSDHFTEFKHSELSDKEGSFFFAQNREDAEAYSGTGRVMEVYVNLQNPIDYNDMPSEIYRLRDKKAQVDALRKLGYDGWMCDMDTGWGEISAFNSNQIKSATNNIGTFDGSNPDIRYQDRTATPSNRELLAQALEGVATDVEDFHAIKEYRRIVPLLDAEEAKLSRLNAQIREMSFGKGKRDNDKLFDLRLEAKQTQNRIDIYDKQLLKLEATAPLRRVLEREKAKAYKRAEQKGKEAVQKEKERAQAKYDELAAKNTASRKKAVEGRHKTEMRHKIQKVVKKLNDLLLNETKDHHIPSGLKKPVAEALDAINVAMSNPADQIAAIDEQIAKAATPEQAAELGVKKAKLEERAARFADKVNALKAAYDAIKQSPDMSLANSYDEVISSNIQEVSELIGETPLYDMSLSQLEAVYDMYRMIAKAVSNGNKAFKMARAESISQLGIAVGSEVTAAGGSHTHSVKALDGIKKFDWNNLKPVYAFERIGSQTFTELFNNVRAGEDVWAVDVTEARDFYLEQSKKYGYDQWDMKKQYAFQSTTGKSFQLTLEQIMSLYAYSKRDQADDHLRMGGFVFDSAIEVVKKKHGIPVKYTVNTATAYNLSPEILADIVDTLTKEQTEFVDVMQDYLSTVMGAKGDEVSMALYDVKLFNKEKHYFPLKSAKQYMFEQNEVAGEIRLKNSGFSKKTQPHASNPIILSNFMDVWAKHVNDMSMYHAFVLPLEDFNRVYHYQSGTGENTDTDSVKGRIQNACGAQANEYISQLIKDLNGGARSDPTTDIISKMTGLFKKGAVFASLSVVVQQPSAIARAVALVDTKYFIGPKVDHKRHKVLWSEVKQYAPVAMIKEMGYFDTNIGKSTQDFITGKDYSGFTDKMKALVTDSNYRDELLSKAPALADEIAWCAIWEAVKRETKAKNPNMDVKSEAFLKKVGERFTEVIVKTQVYDSVLSRSGLMRSKDTGMKMVTAFMAEPTTSINMIADALLQGKRGNRKYCRTAIGAVIASQIINSILVSFVYAGRDDDEDETYVEKYIGTLAGEILDSLNPAGYIPFIKDIVSIVQGYDVERSDMAVISDLWNAWQKLDSDKVSVYEKVEGFAGSIAQFFGLPVKNTMRDVRGIYQTIMSFVNGQKTTTAGIGHAIKGSVTGKDVSNQQQLYEAYMSGDKEQISRVEGRFKDQSAINSAIRKALRENDPRIKEAAQAVINGNAARRVQIVKEIIAEGHFETKDIQAAINAEIDKLREQAKEK